MTHIKKYKIHFLALFFGILLLVVDLITKGLVQEHIPRMNSRSYPYGGIGVFQNFFGIEFSIVHETNTGAAWGVFAAFPDYLLALRMILICGMILYLAFFNTRTTWEVPFALIIAGALGNMLDYFIYGHVIDMFRFIFWGHDYAIFNLADAAIFVGIVWLFVLSWLEKDVAKDTDTKGQNG